MDVLWSFMYYLKHEHECFIRYKTRGAAERFIADKARIASVLNSLKKRSILYSSCHFGYERIFSIDVVQAEKIEAKVL